MFLYVLSQEPLYRAIKASNQVHTFKIPCRTIHMLGFADDTSFFVNSSLSLRTVFSILNDFGLASGIKINTSKTSIMGFGEWRDRSEWPIVDLKTERSEITILGITYCREINLAIELSWQKILSNIKVTIRLLSGRCLSLYQRAVLINSLILSKVWYVAHTYPLPKKYSNLIIKEIFEYLWKSKLNPIKREVIYQDKTKGGLGVFNVFLKSQCILTCTFLKQFLASKENESFLKYFCAIRINPIFNIRELPVNLSYVSPWYFTDIIFNIRRCVRLKNFPCIKSSDMYNFLLPESKPTVQEKYNFTWEKIWPRITFKYIRLDERDVIFKFYMEFFLLRIDFTK